MVSELYVFIGPISWIYFHRTDVNTLTPLDGFVHAELSKAEIKTI